MNSKIILAKGIHIDRDYKNVLSYSPSDMITLLNSNNHFVDVADDFSFIRSQTRVSTPFSFDECIQSNYIAFQNPSYSNKWFFAFIDDVYYKSDGCTEITFTIDSFTTFWEDWQVKPCLVTREHVTDDTIGLHTIPENLESGEYIVNSQDYYNGLDTLKYVLQVTEWSTTDVDKPLATNFGGVFMAGGAYVCDTITEVVTILQQYASRSKSDAVYNLYMIPASMIVTNPGSLQYPGQSSPNTDTKNITKVNTVDGYTPKNNKVLAYPYNYMLISNNNGSSNILHYERFSGNTCNFTVKGVPTVGGNIKIIPTNYDSDLNNEEEGLMAGKFPTLNWSGDEYTNWLTSNGVNLGVGVASTGLSIIGGIASGNISGVVGGALSLANQFASVYQHSLQPNSARGSTNGGDINVCSHKNGFYFYKMSIKAEYARCIDDYFTKFGYKINRLKAPELHSRQYWNYVEIAPSEDIGNGDVPTTYMEQINNAFRRGLTIWHNHENIGNYNLNNTIIT